MSLSSKRGEGCLTKALGSHWVPICRRQRWSHSPMETDVQLACRRRMFFTSLSAYRETSCYSKRGVGRKEEDSGE
ncbi:hypothetical protein SRHO_G00159110 [Serrasalmus rhombeus]